MLGRDLIQAATAAGRALVARGFKPVALMAVLATLLLAQGGLGAAAATGVAVVTGTVTDQATGSSIGGASVTIVDDSTGASETVNTLSDGSYQLFVALPSSSTRFHLLTEADGHRGFWESITLAAGSQQHPVALAPAAVAGSVRDASTGRPLAGAQVAVLSDWTGLVLATATTDGEGSYSLSLPLPVQPQTLHLLVTAAGYTGAWRTVALGTAGCRLPCAPRALPRAAVAPFSRRTDSL
jgi:hypothetical protein